MDKNTCRIIVADVEQALAAVALKHNVKMTYRGGKYTASSFEFKFEAVQASVDGTPAGKEAEAFKQLAAVYGFKPTDLGREFNISGRRVRLVGLKSRSSRRPILVEELGSNKRYVISEDYARMALAAG